MIFYLVIDTAHKTHIVGTQADAAKINKDFEQIDIPTDKAGLMAWVQQMLDETVNDQDHHPETQAGVAPDEGGSTVTTNSDLPAPEPELVVVTGPAPMDPPLSKLLTSEYIQNWLIETADQREIEKIYVAIGCRIGEILRSVR